MDAFNAEYVALMRKYGIQSVADMPALHDNSPHLINTPQHFAPAPAAVPSVYTGLSQYFVPAQSPAVPSSASMASMPQTSKPASHAIPVKAPTSNFFPPTPGFTPEAPSFDYPAVKTAAPPKSVSPTRTVTPTSHMASSKTAWATPEQMAALIKMNDSMTKSKGYVKENQTPRSASKPSTVSTLQGKTMPVTNFQLPPHMQKNTAGIKSPSIGLGANIAKPAANAAPIIAAKPAASTALSRSTTGSINSDNSSTVAQVPKIAGKEVHSTPEVSTITPLSPADVPTQPKTPVTQVFKHDVKDPKPEAYNVNASITKMGKLSGESDEQANTATSPSEPVDAPASKVAKLSADRHKSAVKNGLSLNASAMPSSLSSAAAVIETISSPQTGQTSDKLIDRADNDAKSVKSSQNVNGATSVKKACEAVTVHEISSSNDGAVPAGVQNLLARINGLTNLFGPEVLPAIQSILVDLTKQISGDNDKSTTLINGGVVAGGHDLAVNDGSVEAIVDDIVLKVKYPDGSTESVGTHSKMRISEVLERVIAKKSNLQTASFDDVALIYTGLELDHLSSVGENNLLTDHTVRFTYTKA